MFYQITATAIRYEGKRSVTKQLPTFYLDGNIQGIVDAEHAKGIAGEVIDIWDNPDIELNIHVRQLPLLHE